MSDDNQQSIIVKRVKKGGGAAHGGAWKIAYADFVTAMMAFFLLMWLLGSTTAGDLKGISDYFKAPLKVAMAGGTGTGDSSSVIKGGGEDLTRIYGQRNRSDEDQRKLINLRAVNSDYAAAQRVEMEKLAGLKKQLEKIIESSPTLSQFKNQLLLDLTTEGLRIQIVDEKNRPMFDLASAELKPYTREILYSIAPILNSVPNRITLSGHTDATPFSGGKFDYNNWDLSTDRANASRRALVAGGMIDEKIIRLVGLASAVPYDKADPLNPINRRISIVVLNKHTEDEILRDGAPDPEEHGVASEAQRVPVAPAPTPSPAAPPSSPAPSKPSSTAHR